MSRRTLLLLLAAAGCLGDLVEDGAQYYPDGTDSAGGSSTMAGTSMGSGDSVETVTGEVPTTTLGPDSAASTTGEGLPDAGPVIVSFAFEPEVLHEAGSAQPVAVVSEDVVELSLQLGGVEKWAGPPPTIAWKFEATSSASDGEYTFVLVARDGEGEEAMAEAKLWVSLPASGTEKCQFEEDAGSGWLAAAEYGDEALVVAGALAKPALEATVWRLDPNSCQPQAGYPWAISQWTEAPLVVPPSQAVGLATDELGRMAIAANFGSGLQRRPYVAVLTPQGALEWEIVGPVGQTYSGIAAVPGGVVVVGEQLVNEAPPQYDGLVESFDLEGTKLWTDTLAAPLPGDDWDDGLNIFDEHPRGVAWSEQAKTVMVVGERYIKAEDDKTRLRAFSVQYSANGSLTAAWTSDGLDSTDDGLVTVTRCGEELVAGGWIQNEQSARAPATRWLDLSGNGEQKRRLDALEAAVLPGLACDREEKFTAAISDPVTAYVAGYRTSDDPFLYKLEFPSAALRAASCDARGFCAVAGLQGARPWARVHHP
ncbi:hypothetical protein [Nannocystis sp. SCPEA4]|uniref:hypothetical protein n=1 Tax=Nannocystis sp. SCPEA4 TaxID=2996787 RepID=UPI00226EC1E7|nr:hypothetical protein [Nannocystis sp. SCPEA4]MCY1055507.1 hypothetical protein [Nannocystis sp. SCPEA4]